MAYLREAIANRLRNELRRSCPDVDASVDLDALPSDAPSPLEQIVGRREIARYERALARLNEDDRAAIVARFEMGYSYDALARALARPTADAARKATERALRRLMTLMQDDGA
jgi:DNA-directed RNA polymerase specialized sigma24 family protein